MNEIIELTCPSCGGKLEVSPNTSVLKCHYCGIEHLVERLGDAVTLESFARCPKCGRNDKVEKVSSVVRSQSINSSLVNSLSPFEEPRFNEPSLIQNNLSHTPLVIGIILSIFPIFISCCFFSSFYNSEDKSLLACVIIPLTLLFILGVITLILYFSNMNKINKSNKTNLNLYNKELESRKQEYNRLQKEWQLLNKKWEELYYCYRDDIVFMRDVSDYAPVEKMEDYLYKHI